MAQDSPRFGWKIGGPAGLGIKASGEMFSRTCARSGYHVFDYIAYPSLIKGGHNVFVAHVGARPVLSQEHRLDVLVALNRETIEIHQGELVAGGSIIHDPAVTKFGDGDLKRSDVTLCPVPMVELAKSVGGQKLMANTVALGASLGMMGGSLEALQGVLADQFGHKGAQVVEVNQAAAKAGFDHACANCSPLPVKLSAIQGAPRRMVVDGAAAIGAGAVAAGCTFYAAYPMTPASLLLHFMAQREHDYNVVVKHTEDEIAAMNMTIGAANAGARAMCATSGGGFSLMVEGLGLAGVSESPIVVGVFQRPGPATGMPTWTEQSDLRFCMHAAQGEFPRVILAPGDKEECFTLTALAFNLAEHLQTPIIILGDMYLMESHATVDAFDTARVTVDRGRIAGADETAGGDYRRYRLTDDGISPRALPGTPGAFFIANSYEHDEYGWATEDAAMRRAQVEKRMRKMVTAVGWAPEPRFYGPADAEITIIGWGSTKGPILEAMDRLADEGVKVAYLQVVTLMPFPSLSVLRLLATAQRLLVVEHNYTGQLSGLLREHCFIEPTAELHKYDGRPFYPEEIADRVKQVLEATREGPPGGEGGPTPPGGQTAPGGGPHA